MDQHYTHGAGARLITVGGVIVLLAALWIVEGIAFNAALLTLISIVLVPHLIMIVEPFFAGSSLSPKPKEPLSTATVIVSAYLPNEQEIIVDSLLHIIRSLKFSGNLEVLLVYNTPYAMPIEQGLRELEAMYPALRLIKTEGRSSKADDLNTAVSLSRGEIVALYDADARPEANALERAARWLTAGYDFVQGANVIADNSASLLSRMVAVEFYEKFFVSYSARFNSAKVAYFCGSNGYWRKDTLEQFLFTKEAYVEDIDCALRSALRGARLAYDPAIVCAELAPPTWKAWWRQRLRWAIGWLQLLEKYQFAVFRSSWSFKKKLYWSFFLVWRRGAIPIALLALPPACLLAINKESLLLPPVTLVALLGIVWLAALAQGLAIISRWFTSQQGTVLEVVLYSFLFPFYNLLRLLTTIWAGFVRQTEWSVTPRS